MGNEIPRTVRGFAETLVRIGVATQEEATAALAEVTRLDMDLDEEYDDADELTFLLDYCDTGFVVPEKSVGDREDGYASLLHDAAACSGGSVVVDDVELLEGEDGDDILHFRRNGRSMWWRVEHTTVSARYMDLGAIAEGIGDLVPGDDDPRYFFQLDEDPRDAQWLLLTPGQAAALEEFGLPMADAAANWVRNRLPTAEPETSDWYREDDRLHASEESRRRLDEWLAPMDTALERWRTAHLPDDFPFDHSRDSLSALERLVLERFDGPAAPRDEFFEGAVRYVGETALRLWPCRWTYRYSDDDSLVFTNEPVIRSNAPDAFAGERSPDYELRTLVRRRKPGGLVSSLEEVGEAVDDYRQALRARAR